MQIKIGERVRFLRETTEGIVTKILPKGRAEVLIDDFIEMEVSLEEIVSIDTAERVLTKGERIENESKRVENPSVNNSSPELAVFKNEGMGVSIWFLNNSGKDCVYALYAKIGPAWIGLNAGVIRKGEKPFIAKLSLDELHACKNLFYQGFPFVQKGKPQESFSMEIPLRYTVLSTKVKDIPGFKDPGFIFKLTLEDLSEVLSESISHKQIQKLDSPPPEEVDLHIEALTEYSSLLDSIEMMTVQMAEFEKQLDKAKLYGFQKITFIHGVGEGVLSGEIHRRLKNIPFVKSFAPADPGRFGNGATVVYLK